MRNLTLTLFLTPLLGFAQTLTITKIDKTEHPYALKLTVHENYHHVLVDCDSFLHGVFLFYNINEYDWHEIDEDSCFEMVTSLQTQLSQKDRIKLLLKNSHPFYQILPSQLPR